jgi:eukaryotic translation initiation factor 2C
MPGQPANAKLSPAQTQQMIRFVVRKPTSNAHSIVTSGSRLLGFASPNATLVRILFLQLLPKTGMLTVDQQSFDINVTPQLITVPGRVLPSPDIKYAGTQTTKPRFGS